VVPSGSETPVAVSDAVAADEVVEAETMMPGDTVGIVTDAAELVLTAAMPMEEVVRTPREVELDLALHADFLDEVMVELV
jgi:hypothetical protein